MNKKPPLLDIFIFENYSSFQYSPDFEKSFSFACLRILGASGDLQQRKSFNSAQGLEIQYLITVQKGNFQKNHFDPIAKYFKNINN